MLFGRSRSVSAAVGRRASTSKANQRAADAADDLEALGDQIIASQQALEAEIRDITASVRAEAGAIVAEPVRLSKSGLDVRWTMLWVPARRPV